jgi:hypothetical protein
MVNVGKEDLRDEHRVVSVEGCMLGFQVYYNHCGAGTLTRLRHVMAK